jgi:hypothetical protein
MASEALPHSNREEGAAASRGRVVHRFLEVCLEKGRDQALAEAPEEDLAALECIDVEALPAAQRESFAAEISIAYDPWTEAARVLGSGLSREEARARAYATEMVGTVDVAGLEPDRAVAWDYKSGRGHVEPAPSNWQVWTYLLMLARAYGVRGARGGIIRVPDGAGPWYDEHVMDELALAAHAARLRELLEARQRVLAERERAARELVPYEGVHCRYCPAANRCPSRVAAVLALASGNTAEAMGHFGTATTELGNEAAALAWRRLQNAQRTLDRVKAVLLEHARENPIDLGEGLEVAERVKITETIIADRARRVLEHEYQELGPVLFGAAAKTKTSLPKEALRKAIARFVMPTRPKSKITWEFNGAMQALRAGGAVSVDEVVTVDEHRAESPPTEEAA